MDCFPKIILLTENSLYEQVLEEVELIKEAGDAFNQEKIARGDQTPVFLVLHY